MSTGGTAHNGRSVDVQKRKGAAPAGDTSALAELFKLPLDQFTAARNARAARLKKNGHPEEAAQLKALSKPPLSAWAVNQLFWRHPKDLEALLDSGERFRHAQAQQLAGKHGDLRGTLDARRQTLTALSRLAADILREGGHTPGPDIERRVTTHSRHWRHTGRQPGAPQAGFLTADIDPPGFEALAALVPRGAGSSERIREPRVLTSSRPSRPPRRRRCRRPTPNATRSNSTARGWRRQRQRCSRRNRRSRVRGRRARAEDALKKAAAVAREADKQRAEIEARLEKAAAAANKARQDARRVASTAEDAAQAVTDAERGWRRRAPARPRRSKSAVGSRQWAVAVASGQSAVGSRQWVVSSGQWAVNRGAVHAADGPLPTANCRLPTAANCPLLPSHLPRPARHAGDFDAELIEHARYGVIDDVVDRLRAGCRTPASAEG